MFTSSCSVLLEFKLMHGTDAFYNIIFFKGIKAY